MQSRVLKSFARFESDWTFRESFISLMFLTNSSLSLGWLNIVIHNQSLRLNVLLYDLLVSRLLKYFKAV